MKRVILYCLFMFFLLSLSVPQSNYKYRGYSKIKLIEIIGEKNPIISEYRLNSMAISMGYNTLPKGIYFDKDSYNANVSNVELLMSGNSRFIEYQSKNSTSESWLSQNARYSLLHKSTIINNFPKSSIVNIVREYI